MCTNSKVVYLAITFLVSQVLHSSYLSFIIIIKIKKLAKMIR